MQISNLRLGGFTLLEMPSRVKYGLLALIELGKVFTEQKAMTIKEIAKKQPIPERYLDQVMVSLRQSGLVQSYRGTRGGYALNFHPDQITILDVVMAVEGKQNGNKKLLSSSSEITIIQEIWQDAQSKAQIVLKERTIGDLCQKSIDNQQTCLAYEI
jgi:Rrf2 family protein